MTPIPNGSTPSADAAGTDLSYVPAATESLTHGSVPFQTDSGGTTSLAGVEGDVDRQPIQPGSGMLDTAAQPHGRTPEQTTGAAVGGVSATIPDDVMDTAEALAVVDSANREHMALHNRVRQTFIGRRVTVKPAVNGIKERTGVIANTILTYNVSFGIDIDRLDGRPGTLDRLWFGMRQIELQPQARIRKGA